MDDQSQLHITIDEDRLSARMTMPEGFDRAMLTPGLCDAALVGAGIELSPATKELVERFIGEATTASPGAFSGLIARGTPPRHGKDGQIQWMLDPLEDDPPSDGEASADDDAAQASFYDRSRYTIVHVGDKLAKVYHATPGIDGRDVTGKTLAAKDGKPYDFKHDESLLIGSDDLVTAQANGVLDRSGGTICIRDTIEVDRYVDFSTGNIQFNGSVIVHKGVCDCFKIDADHDIEVRGLIEAANLVAGRDLRALGGFAGREQGTAEVRGDLHAKYLDAVTASVRGNLCVEREIINANCTVLGQIDSPTGSIIGGQTRVAGAVTVAEIGAEGMPLTTVHLGVVPHLDPLIEQLAALADDLRQQRAALVDEQDTIKNASGARVTAGNKERLCELMYEIAEVQAQLDRVEPALASASARADTMRAVEVRVGKAVFPNTLLVCAGMSYRVRQALTGPLRITAGKKRMLELVYADGQPQSLARACELRETA